MSRFHRLLGPLTLALFLPVLAAAQDRDTQEIQKYVLTDAGLAKYSQAARKLVTLPAAEVGACVDEESDAQSIDRAAARYNKYPAAKGAIQEAGMTPREYVVFSFALLNTGLAVWAADEAGGKLPPGTSATNVAFYRKNKSDLKKLEELGMHPDCEDENAEEEEIDE